MRSNLKLFAFFVAAAVSIGFISSANADSVVLCVKKIGKTNNKGRDAYIARDGKCRSPLYKAVDISFANSLAGPQGPTGPQGPQGPQGPAGVNGAQGPAGLLDVASCYKKSETWEYENGGDASGSQNGLEVSVRCNDPMTEMVIEHGYSTEYMPAPNTSEALMTDENGGTFPYSVGHLIGFQYASGAAQCEGYCPKATVTVVCCDTGVTTQPTTVEG